MPGKLPGTLGCWGECWGQLLPEDIQTKKFKVWVPFLCSSFLRGLSPQQFQQHSPPWDPRVSSDSPRPRQSPQHYSMGYHYGLWGPLLLWSGEWSIDRCRALILKGA